MLSPRQAFLKKVYPVITRLSRLFGSKATTVTNIKHAVPQQSIYNLEFTASNGSPISLSNYQGKKLMLVNTASDCGYTGQYDELQKLYTGYNDELVVIAFPANDFHDQEKADDKEIEGFCRINYGVTFPLASKSIVISKPNQNPVFQWLSDPAKNGWNNQAPEWNFSKYLVDEQGVLLGYFGPAISPLDKSIVQLIDGNS